MSEESALFDKGLPIGRKLPGAADAAAPIGRADGVTMPEITAAHQVPAGEGALPAPGA